MAQVIGKTKEQRRFSRVPYSGALRYRYAPDEAGVATWLDVGRGGACVRIGRYLRPGRHLLLTVSDVDSPGKGEVDLKGQVMWCRPSEDNKSFVTGVRIFRHEPEVEYALSEIILDALAQSGEMAPEPPARPKAKCAKPWPCLRIQGVLACAGLTFTVLGFWQ